MIEKVVTWAIAKVVEEEIDDSVLMATLLGVLLDTAAFKAVGLPTSGAMAAGGATGAAHSIYKKTRGRA